MLSAIKVSNFLNLPDPHVSSLYAAVTKILYAAMMLYAVFPPSVLVAGGFSAVVVVETLSSIAKSPITSLVDAAVRHSFGGDG